MPATAAGHGTGIGAKAPQAKQGLEGSLWVRLYLVREHPKLHLLCLWRACPSEHLSWGSVMPMPEAPSMAVHLCPLGMPPRAFHTSQADLLHPAGLVIPKKMSCSSLGITSWSCQGWG